MEIIETGFIRPVIENVCVKKSMGDKVMSNLHKISEGVVVACIFVLIYGCTRAPGPVLYIDPAALYNIESISVERVVNVTPEKEITSLVEEAIKTELPRLRRYKIKEEDSDAVITCIITEYTPLKSELVQSGKDVDYSVSDYTETKEELKRGRGCVLGALVDVFIPSHRVKGGEEYEYKTIIQSPVIGIELTLKKGEYVLYKGSKLISTESRIPDCYSATYENILPKERLNSIDFLVSLAIKELVEPLK